jgi:hypothetical protein
MQVSHLSKAFEDFSSLFPPFDLDQRKAILVACQVQSYPHKGSRIRNRLEDAWRSIVHLQPRHTPFSSRERYAISETLLDLVRSGDDYFPSPIFSGFISSVIRSAPVDDHTSFHEALEKGIAKEILASVFEYRPTKLDYRSIFSNDPTDRNHPLAENLDGDPSVAQGIREAFFRVRQSLDGDEQFVEHLFGTSDPKYEFSVMKEIPTWMYTLMHK